MLRYLFAILTILIAGFNFSVSSPSPTHHIYPDSQEAQHVTTHKLTVYDMIDGKGFNGAAGHCSGTEVGPHALLTAQHCLLDSNLVKLDNSEFPLHVLSAILDGNDHVIYIVDETFTSWSSIDERDLVPGEPVHFWGYPGDGLDVYRIGYFDRFDINKEVDPSEAVKFEWFILPTFGGDSGSGIFDAQGKIISVVSMADKSANTLNLPLAFTAAQLQAATK